MLAYQVEISCKFDYACLPPYPAELCAAGMHKSQIKFIVLVNIFTGRLHCPIYQMQIITKVSRYQRKNFRRLVSISCRLCTHSYSPYLESNVPFCKDRSFKVNLGPNSCKPHFFWFLNWYLWYLKKMKSLWLWKVTTLRPVNWGSCGNIDARSLPTEWPRRVLKLFKTTSGVWLEWSPLRFKSLPNFTLDNLKWAVGPSGKCDNTSPFGSCRFSFITSRSV